MIKKIFKALFLICSLGAVVAGAIGCTSTADPILVQFTSYKRVKNILIYEDYSTNAKEKKLADVYWYRLQRGRWLAALLRKIDFDEKGTWESSWDPIDKMLLYLAPELIGKITTTEKHDISSTLGELISNIINPFCSLFPGDSKNLVARLVEHNEGSNTRFALKIAVSGLAEKRIKEWSENANSLVHQWVSEEEKLAGAIQVVFGHFTDKRAVWKNADGYLAKMPGNDLFKKIENIGMDGYWHDGIIYRKESFEDNEIKTYANEKAYSMAWMLSYDNWRDYQREYEDSNKNANQLKITIITSSENQ